METQKILFSIIESPSHPNFSSTYSRLGFKEVIISSMRKAISQLKKIAPDFIVAEFCYAYSSNYSAIHTSNLDVLLYSLKKYSPETKVIVLVKKDELEYVDHIQELFPLHAILSYPISEAQINAALKQ
ncbi:MAG: hypothetical protein GQ470_01970 [Gammaproteobacteria bacterium]|nr:hypothetical protein [Gammaproteobacteria bacterium]